MAKKPTVTTVSSGFASNTQLNSNFTALRDAFDNTLSLDGSTPNAMQADLDLNGNALLNVGSIDADNLTLNGQTVTELSSVPEWRGAWVTARSYAKNDLVKQAGSSYICLVAHTSGTFSTDLTMLLWELFAEKGAAGAGTGDMLGANNLSDVVNAATARSNLGLGTVATENTVPVAKGGTGATDAATARTNLGLTIGTNVQAYDAALASLAGLSLVQGDLLYATGADTVARLAIGTANQVLQVNAGATAPEWTTRSGAPDFVLEDQKSSGTAAQSLTGSTWNTRDLNTEVRDNGGIVSITTNQFTPTVSGWVEWQTHVFSSTGATSRLWNVTDGVLAGQGMGLRPNTGSVGVLTGGAAVIAGKAYRLEVNPNATVNGGDPQTKGVEIYTRILGWRA